MWKYNGEKITDIDQFPYGTFGFVYRVLNKKTGKAYIGKKVLYHSIKKKLTKKELAEIEGQGRRPSYRLTIASSVTFGVLISAIHLTGDAWQYLSYKTHG